MKKDKFIYKVYCNLFGEAFYTSLKKANIFKEYLMVNYKLEIAEEHKPNSILLFDCDFFNDAGNGKRTFIRITKTPLNLY